RNASWLLPQLAGSRPAQWPPAMPAKARIFVPVEATSEISALLIARQPGQVGMTISASEKWLLKIASFPASGPRAARSARNRSSVQFETPKLAIDPRSSSENRAPAHSSTSLAGSSGGGTNAPGQPAPGHAG